MSLPPLNSHDPAAVAADAAARRRTHIVTRTASLRTLGTAGAISALGVFTGLAAAHSPASPKPAAIAPPAADAVASTTSDLRAPSDDGFVPDDRGGFDDRSPDGQAAGDFFAQQSQSGAAQGQGNRTVNPAPHGYVAPPRPAAPPAAMASTS